MEGRNHYTHEEMPSTEKKKVDANYFVEGLLMC